MSTHYSVLITVLLIAVSNPAPRQIIRRHFHAYAVANQNANSVFPHFPGHRREHSEKQLSSLSGSEEDFEKARAKLERSMVRLQLAGSSLQR